MTGDPIEIRQDAEQPHAEQPPSPVHLVISGLAAEAHRLADNVLAMPGRSPLEVAFALSVRQSCALAAGRWRAGQ